MNDALPQMPASGPDVAEDIEVTRGTHMFLGLCVAVVVCFGIWSATAELDIVSTATGEVAPSSNVKSVQHLEGGIVTEILVKEGDRIAKGQPLIVLSSTQTGADVDELKVRIRALRADVIRFEAEIAEAKSPTFPPYLVAADPEIVKKSLATFETRRQRMLTQINAQLDAIKQRKLEIREVQARRASAQKSLKLLSEQVGISEKLLAKDLTNRMLHLNLLKEQTDLVGRIEEAEAALPRLEAALGEAQSNLETIRASFREEAQKSRDEAALTLDELSQRVRKFEDSLAQTTLRAPVDGVIKTLHVFTLGGVVQAGKTVVDIVPADDRLVIDAKLPTQDIGYVRQGQDVKVMLASGDASRFGDLKGVVENVSPDTLVTERGMPFYKVRISTERTYFESGKLRYDLFPGMQVICSIQTGSRTVLEYILDPLIGRIGDALRER